LAEPLVSAVRNQLEVFFRWNTRFAQKFSGSNQDGLIARTKGEHHPNPVPQTPQDAVPNPPADADRLEAAADEAIAAFGGIARDAVRALIVANKFLESGTSAN
jgi:hypothetical protein